MNPSTLVQLRKSRLDAPTVKPAQARRRVALISAPFGGVDTPSLALGLLAATLRRDGHRVDVHHVDLDVVKAFGLSTYRWVAEDSGWRFLVGEWLAADGTITPDRTSRAKFEELLRTAKEGTWRSRVGRIDLDRLRTVLDDELERFFSRVRWETYDVVGFTVMFQQLGASLRLARKIKDRHPHVRVVLGGINLEGPAGLAVAEHFPWLDAVFRGYADDTFPHWVNTLPPQSGIVNASETQIVLDDLPIPEFDEYFRRVRELGLEGVRPQVPLEIARGCWWGEKHHCIFCGLNGAQMVFNQKSAPRVVKEIRALKSHGRKLFLVDNILAPNAYEVLLPQLRDEDAKLDVRWSASLKANLTRPKLVRLLEAGIDVINPGIESLSTELLRLMDKGETSVQNIWLLRACRELGLRPEWHLLWGFPGEDPAVYADQAALIPMLTHLPAPLACVEVDLVRFSPMQKWPERFGIRGVRPHRAYTHAFGNHPMVGDVAYHFEFDFPAAPLPSVYAKPALDAAEAWRAAGGLLRPRCEAVYVGRELWLLDTRPAFGRHFGRLSKAAWELLERLDRPTFPKDLVGDEQVLADLERRGLVIRRDGRWVRLVVFPAERNYPRRIFNKLARELRLRSS